MKRILFPMTGILLVVLSLTTVIPAMAHSEVVPQTKDLIAGQNTVIGTVSVWDDGNNLHVTYQTTGDWVLTATHLYVGHNEPLTRAPGQFPYGDEFAEPQTSAEYIIPITEIDSYSQPKGKKLVADEVFDVEIGSWVFIAAHADVCEFVDDQCQQQETAWVAGHNKNGRFRGWATYFGYEIQGPSGG